MAAGGAAEGAAGGWSRGGAGGDGGRRRKEGRKAQTDQIREPLTEVREKTIAECINKIKHAILLKVLKIVYFDPASRPAGAFWADKIVF